MKRNWNQREWRRTEIHFDYEGHITRNIAVAVKSRKSQVMTHDPGRLSFINRQ